MLRTLLFALLVSVVFSRRSYVHMKDSVVAVTYATPAADDNTVAATVDYDHSMNRIGWDTLNITTNSAFSDVAQAYAAGFGEGQATAAVSWKNWLDLYGAYPNGTQKPNNVAIPPKVAQFINENWQWTLSQVAKLNQTDSYWYQVGLQVTQWQGLLDGINRAAAPDQKMSFLQLQYTTLVGDLYDIIPGLKANSDEKDWRAMSKDEYDSWFVKRTRCSALIKLVQDFSDIYFGHATWSSLNSMVRIFKVYTLNYNHGSTFSKQISFSSYPGCLSSIDDYYMTDTKLVLIETSLAVLNQSMYEGNIRTDTLMYWIRVMVSSRMATSGREWVNTFAKYNSGTYNNQWMALDLNLFTPGKDLLPGTLYIAEQMPGVVEIQDVTQILSYGYWPSYNVPSIPSLYKAAGYAEAVAAGHSEMNDYQRCVRAQIFRRDQANVQDMPAFMYMMQYNDYQNDPISQGNPIYAIAARGDKKGMCFAAIDAKVSSYLMAENGRQILAYSGPTPQQGVFDFATSNSTAACTGPIYAMPTRFDFLWRHFKPQL